MALEKRTGQGLGASRSTVAAVERGVRPQMVGGDDVATSEELARRAQAGSARAFELLYDRYERSLWRFLRVLAGSAADADELTQQTFVRAWRHLDRYRPAWSFSTWLFTIGRRQAMSWHRTAARGPRALDDDHRRTLVAREVADAADVEEQRQNLWHLAGRVLTPDQRSALWLRYAEGLTTLDVASVLGKSEASVRVVLHRARRKLAEHLDEDPS